MAVTLLLYAPTVNTEYVWPLYLSQAVNPATFPSSCKGKRSGRQNLYQVQQTSKGTVEIQCKSFINIPRLHTASQLIQACFDVWLIAIFCPSNFWALMVESLVGNSRLTSSPVPWILIHF